MNLSKSYNKNDSAIVIHSGILVLQDIVKSKARSGRGGDGTVTWFCSECDYHHKKNSNVFRHIQRKHVYFCYDCTQAFESSEELMRHKAINGCSW